MSIKPEPSVVCGELGFVDASQALQFLVPGVYLSTQMGAFSYINLALQGSRTSDVLWTVDGVRINNRLYNGTSPADTLPSSMIERMEVLKGGQGVLYGTQAAAGVINASCGMATGSGPAFRIAWHSCGSSDNMIGGSAGFGLTPAGGGGAGVFGGATRASH